MRWARLRSTTSPSCHRLSMSMAKRLTEAPGGRAIRKRPSMVRSSGLSKDKCSSVNTNGPCMTDLASTEVSRSALPAAVVKAMGAAAPPSSLAAVSKNPSAKVALLCSAVPLRLDDLLAGPRTPQAVRATATHSASFVGALTSTTTTGA